MDIKNVLEVIPSIDCYALMTYFEYVHSMLVNYEHEYCKLEDAALLLELALWKSKIDESMQNNDLGQNEQMDDITADLRRQCRINCGSDVIIPNVLPFLIANEE